MKQMKRTCGESTVTEVSPIRRKLFSLVWKGNKKYSYILIKIPCGLRIYGWLYRLLKPRGVKLISVQTQMMYVDCRDDIIVPELLALGIWQELETNVFKRSLRPGMVVADIGANIGYFTIIGAKITGNLGKVYSFEPEPNNFNLLTASVEINGCNNVITIPKLVSNKSGKQKLFLDQNNLGAHTLSYQNIQTVSAGSLEVEAITLDEYFESQNWPNVDLIKMDVQGAEGLVLQGAQKLLSKDGIRILMEFWPSGLRNIGGTDPESLLRMLRDYGFRFNILGQSLIYNEKDDKRILELAEKSKYVDLMVEKP